MQVFEQEKLLGLNDKILNSMSSTMECSVAFVSEDDFNKKNIVIAEEITNKHPSLMYCRQILVSTVMNDNDDIFLPEETWAARTTPINTPFNDNHVSKDIIGHIIATSVLNRDGSLYIGESCPDYFDIAVWSVVYQDVFPEKAQEIYDGFIKNTKFVSMEASLNNFDYGIIKNNEIKVIKRNKDTAFLTKYLRIYGGSGIFEDYRIGRVLRNITFIGMGSVDNPANKRSKYIDIINYNKKEVYESLESLTKSIFILTKGNEMKKFENIDEAVAYISEQENEISKLAKTIEDSKADYEAKISKLEEQIASNEGNILTINDSLKAEQGKVSIAEVRITELNTSIDEYKTKCSALESSLKVAEDKLAEIDKAKKIEARKDAFAKLNINYPEDKIVAMSDEVFDQLVDFAKSTLPVPKNTPEQDTTVANNVITTASNDDLVINDSGEDINDLKAVANKLASAITKKSAKKNSK